MSVPVPALGLIVEGHGEVSAVPVLVRRIVADAEMTANVLHPHRIPKGRMPSDLGRAVRLQYDRVAGKGGVIVMVDADDDDPLVLAEGLLNVIDQDVKAFVRIVVALKEYEAWFLAGIESLRVHRSIRDDAVFVGDPEAPRDAKGRLQDQMTESYQETIHQVAFSSVLDLQAAALGSASFRLLRTSVLELLQK